MSSPRIISLLPSATEIVGALGVSHLLVGVTHECDVCPDAAGMQRLLESGVIYFFQIRTTGGAVSDVARDATAFAHRDANFSITAMGVDRGLTDKLWDELSAHFDGLYLSFETDRSPERLLEAFPPPVIERLRALKRRYDPTNLFRDNFNIAPDGPAAEAGQGQAA